MEKAIEKATKLKFLMFENETNICWLDASIALVAHNRTFEKIVQGSSESVIKKIISTYKEAVKIFNDSESAMEQRRLKTKELLLAIQNTTQEHLKNFLKFKPGEPDSAFCALLNLIYQDKSNIKEKLSISYKWKKQCSNCGSKSTSAIKPIVTFSKVITFNPLCPTSMFMCTCKSEQEMKLIYKTLPPCLIFHFEKGAGANTNFHLSFSMKDREYQLTAIVILEKSSDPNLNHFVTWIRNPFLNLWLECNDLNTSFATFSPVKPEFDLKDVYISVYETFDNYGKIINDETSDQEQDDEDVELIDLSDEDDDTKNTDFSFKTRLPSNDIKNDKTSNILQDSRSEGDISKKELLVNDVKNTSVTTVQNFKMSSNKISKESVKSKNQNAFARNLKFPIKISLEAKSKTFDCQDKAVDESIEAKKFKTEATGFSKNKVTESSVENFSNLLPSNVAPNRQNLAVHNNGKSNEEISNISSQNISVSSSKSPSENPFNKYETEMKFKNVIYQDKVFDESIEDKKSKLVIDNQVSSGHKVTHVSDGNNKKMILSSVNNKTSMMQNSEMHICKKFKESEKNNNVSSQNTLTKNLKFPIKVSLAKHQAKSKTFDYQDKVVDKFTEGKEFKAKATDFQEHKVIETSVENEEENFFNLYTINKTSNVPVRNVSVSNFKSSSKIPFKKHEIEEESKNIVCQDKVIDEAMEAKKSKLIIDNQSILEHKDTDTSCENKDFLSPSVSNKQKSKKLKESEKTRNVSSDKDEIEAKSKNFNFPDKTIETSVKQLKYETSNCSWPKITEKRERVEDICVNSSERKTKITDDKYVNSNEAGNAEILNNKASSTSLTEKTNENLKLSENVDGRRKVMVPSVVEKAFAAFLSRIIEIRENKLNNQTSDSAT